MAPSSASGRAETRRADDRTAKGGAEMLLPVTNSPRMGVCAYTGELDDYAFDPK